MHFSDKGILLEFSRETGPPGSTHLEKERERNLSSGIGLHDVKGLASPNSARSASRMQTQGRAAVHVQSPGTSPLLPGTSVCF